MAAAAARVTKARMRHEARPLTRRRRWRRSRAVMAASVLGRTQVSRWMRWVAPMSAPYRDFRVPFHHRALLHFSSVVHEYEIALAENRREVNIWDLVSPLWLHSLQALI